MVAFAVIMLAVVLLYGILYVLLRVLENSIFLNRAAALTL
jgi:hypothetical protein